MKSYISRVILPSIIEVWALVFWFLLVLTKKDVLAISVLFIGLVIEHLVAQAIYDAKAFRVSAGKWIGVSLFETIVWAVWLAILRAKNPLIAYSLLFVGLLIEHTMSVNILERRTALERLTTPAVIAFTIIEVINASVLSRMIPTPHMTSTQYTLGAWLFVAMLVLSTIEHAMQFRVADEKG